MMNSWIRNEIGLEFFNIHIQFTIETHGGRHTTANSASNSTISGRVRSALMPSLRTNTCWCSKTSSIHSKKAASPPPPVEWFASTCPPWAAKKLLKRYGKGKVWMTTVTVPL